MMISRTNKFTKKKEFMCVDRGGQIKWSTSPWQSNTGYSQEYAESQVYFERNQSVTAKRNRETFEYSIEDSSIVFPSYA